MSETVLSLVGLVLDGLAAAVETCRPHATPRLAAEIDAAITTARHQLENPVPEPRFLRFTAAPHHLGASVTDQNGERVDGIVSATIELRPDKMPTATVEVAVLPDITVGSTEVHWYGLEQVPTDALHAELARRWPNRQLGVLWPDGTGVGVAWLGDVDGIDAQLAALLHAHTGATLVYRDKPTDDWQPVHQLPPDAALDQAAHDSGAGGAVFYNDQDRPRPA